VTAATEETKECPVCNGLAIAFCSGPCFGTGRVPATHPELLKAGERRTTNASISEAMRQGEERLAGHLAKIGTLADSLPTSAEDERVVDELMGKREVVVRPMAPAAPAEDLVEIVVDDWELRAGAEPGFQFLATIDGSQLAKLATVIGAPLTMSADSEVAPACEQGEPTTPDTTTSEPAGTIREPNIELRCEACGNSTTVPRLSHDHPEATVCVMNQCDKCNAAEGGFEETTYYDASGTEISSERMAAFLHREDDTVAQSDLGGPSDEELAAVVDAVEHLPARDIRRALCEAGRASRDAEVAELEELTSTYKKKADRSEQDCATACGRMRRQKAELRAELSEKDARIASLTEQRDKAESARIAERNHRIDLQEIVRDLEVTRKSLLERAKAMDVRNGVVTKKYENAKEALRVCLAQLGCYEWYGPNGTCVWCMRDDHDAKCSHVEVVEAARKALKEKP
jgi:hypothetical protein